MERDDVVLGDAAKTGIGANRQVRVRMRPVHQPEERLLGDRRSHVLQLAEAIETQLTDARELAFEQAWSRDHVSEQGRAARREPGQRRQ